MAPEERVARGEDGKDTRLCYPPLSGKVLSVVEIPEQGWLYCSSEYGFLITFIDNALQISIMRKETLVLEANSRLKRDRILDEFQECISFAKTSKSHYGFRRSFFSLVNLVSRAAQEPVPPLPPIGSLPQSPVSRLKTSASSSRERPERASNPRLLTHPEPVNFESERTDDATSKIARVLAASSPKQDDGLTVIPLSRTSTEQQQHVVPTATSQDSRRDAVNTPLSSPVSPGNRQQLPALHNPGPMHLPRRSSAGHGATNPPSSYVPGQIVPPVRSASVRSQSPPSTMTTSDLPGGPYGVSPQFTQNPAPQNSSLRHHASMHSLRQQPQQHKPSLQFLPPRPNHPNFPPAPHHHPGPQPPNRQSFSSLPSGPAATSHPGEQSSHKLQKSLSTRSLHAQYQHNQTSLPPVPSLPDGLSMQRPFGPPKDTMGPMNVPMSRTLLPSMQMGSRTNSVAEPSILDPSPPTSPVQERKPLGPVRSVITAQMKCKVFHQQHHAQWKSLGSANLTLYRQEPTNVKQLVVEAGGKDKSILISTIVLTDGVERVGKTGVAIELSDAGGARTGVIYMIQLRNEDSASGLYKNLLAGSDRAA